ncbi:hypothetical protein BDR22DRAFT_888779 [Usnea florida]
MPSRDSSYLPHVPPSTNRPPLQPHQPIVMPCMDPSYGLSSLNMNENFDGSRSTVLRRGGSFYKPHRGPVLGFGIEIEIISIAMGERVWNREEFQTRYRNMMVQKLVQLGEMASQHPVPGNGNIREWFITTDGSLSHADDQVAFEANSPVFNSRAWEYWQTSIDKFWKAVDKCDIDPGQEFGCGSHIHVAPFSHSQQNRAVYTMEQLRSIAYAVLTQEWCIYRILPQNRQNNKYCQPNSQCVRHGAWGPTSSLANRKDISIRRLILKEIYAKGDEEQLREYMQGHERRALWNFKNTVQGRAAKLCKGTIEFRGGRHLRDEKMTKRWIAFVIAFIAMAIEKSNPDPLMDHSDMNQWWSDVRDQAKTLELRDLLPDTWEEMRDLNELPYTKTTIRKIRSDRSIRRIREEEDRRARENVSVEEIMKAVREGRAREEVMKAVREGRAREEIMKAEREKRAREEIMKAEREKRAREEIMKAERERRAREEIMNAEREKRAREEIMNAEREKRARENIMKAEREKRAREEAVKADREKKRATEEAEKASREKRAQEEAEKAKDRTLQQLRGKIKAIENELALQKDIISNKTTEYDKALNGGSFFRSRNRKLEKISIETRAARAKVARLESALKYTQDELREANYGWAGAQAISTAEAAVGVVTYLASGIGRLLT